MTTVFVLAAGLWGLGALLKTPHSARWLMLGLLYVAVLGVNVALPAGHPLREGTGGSAGEWLVLAGLVGLVWLYRRGLGALKARVRPENRPAGPAPGSFAPGELDRYARHIVLREIGGPGQKRLKQAKVLVVGAGGLGSPTLLYLASAGVGTIGVIDPDMVEATNLQRQVIHSDARIGMPKVFSAERAMKAINPFLTVRPYHRKLTEDIAEDLIAEYDLVLEGTDDLDTKYLVNRAAAATGVPVVGGALSQWEGQIATFAPADGAPCYACIFPTKPAPGLGATCAEAGVLGPLPGVIGTMMAVEAIKELTGAGEGLRGRLFMYDALCAETRTITTRRRPDCPVCGTG